MRFETNSTKLQLTFGKLIINFVTRILRMEDTRIARICYAELSKTADLDHKRYNWVTGLREMLKLADSEELGPTADPNDWLLKKSDALNNLEAKLRQADIDKA
jgi:hypothetical protein